MSSTYQEFEEVTKNDSATVSVSKVSSSRDLGITFESIFIDTLDIWMNGNIDAKYFIHFRKVKPVFLLRDCSDLLMRVRDV